MNLTWFYPANKAIPNKNGVLDILNTWSMFILCWASVVDGWHTSIQQCQSYSVHTIGLHLSNVFLMLGLHRKQWPAITQYWVWVYRADWDCIPVGVLGWLLVVVLFAPIRGGSLGICFVCWMLLRHCTEALVYSNHPRAAAASSYLAIIFGRIASGVPWFLRSTAEPMQHPHQC